ncbi:MAG: DUF4468 domain-containing protein [Bacteroidota bacterium]
MKRTSVELVILVAFLSSCSMTVIQPSAKSSTVNVGDNSKLQLYVKANDWMISEFNNAESVIQFTDKESGVITGKYLMHTFILGTSVPPKYLYAIIKLQVKDGAAKITITPSDYVNNYNIMAGGTGYTVEEANMDMDHLIQSFEKAMKAKVDEF